MYMRNDTLYKTAYNKYVFKWRNPGSFFTVSSGFLR